MTKNYSSKLDELCRKDSSYYLNSIDLIAASNFLRPEIANLTAYKIHRSMEGLLDKRPYAGTKYLNEIEKIGVEAAKKLFKVEYVNIQPHSGSQANQIAYSAFLEPGDRVLSMKFDNGGHLTHGNPINFSGKFYKFAFYEIDPKTQQIDYKEIEDKAKEYKPKMIVVGASSYPRIINYELVGKIAKKYGAYFMADIAHPIGLIVAGKHPSPAEFADVITGSTEKTFWGPHSGIIMGKLIHQKRIDRAVHPGVQSSVPIDRIIQVGKSILFAGTLKFKKYIETIMENAKVLESAFQKIPNCLQFGGTDCHFIVINVKSGFGITGLEAEKTLENLGIFTNRQVIPGECNKVYITSGLRIGTTSATGMGYCPKEFKKIAEIMVTSLTDIDNSRLQNQLKKETRMLIDKHLKGTVAFWALF